MAEQTEKAFLKQPKVFLSSKKSGKGKRPGKGGNRYWKSIGLGFKTPREAIEGLYHSIAVSLCLLWFLLPSINTMNLFFFFCGF
uniref:Small ribosomal subunit protein uS17 N-terminal domain-containing protein n=1 Tax=Rhizophora mucronata TaxID=61149 RepID=A0A2P2JGB3_RHIMU